MAAAVAMCPTCTVVSGITTHNLPSRTVATHLFSLLMSILLHGRYCPSLIRQQSPGSRRYTDKASTYSTLREATLRTSTKSRPKGLYAGFKNLTLFSHSGKRKTRANFSTVDRVSVWGFIFVPEWLKSRFLVKVLCCKGYRLFFPESDKRGLKSLSCRLYLFSLRFLV